MKTAGTIRLVLLVTALTLTAAVSAPATAGAADNDLVLSSADLPGFKAGRGGARVARQAIDAPAPSSVRRARTRGRAFRAGSERLTIGVFTFRSTARAGRALAQLRRARRGSRTLKVAGATAYLRRRASRRSSDVAVAVRVDEAVGAVRLRKRGRSRGTAVAARGLARALALRLRRVLALTEWQLTLDRIGPDGSVSPAVALRAFAVVHGSLPGVPRPRGDLGVPASGTQAMRLVARVWDRLTPAQQTAINTALNAPRPPGAATAVKAAAPVAAPEYQPIADEYVERFRGKLPPGPVPQVKVVKETSKATHLADAMPIGPQGTWGSKQPAHCRVTVQPPGQAQSVNDKRSFEVTIAHEVFHCFEFVLTKKWDQTQEWIVEGMAEWAGVSVTEAAPAAGAPFYIAYLNTITPKYPLFGRAYGAMGFWFRAEEVNGSLWPNVPRILDAGGNRPSYELAGGTNPAFLDSWASAAWRLQGAGAAWNQTRPYVIGEAEAPRPAAPVAGRNADVRVPPTAMGLYDVFQADPRKQLVKVTASRGILRAGVEDSPGGGGRDLGRVGVNWYCFGKCECEAGETSQIPDHEKLGAAAKLAIAATGGLDPAAGRITFHDHRAEFCEGERRVCVASPGGSRYLVVPGKSIGGVQLGQTRECVMKSRPLGLAKPTRTHPSGGILYDTYATSGFAGALVVGYLDSKVVLISTGAGPWRTASGLAYGDPPSKAIQQTGCTPYGRNPDGSRNFEEPEDTTQCEARYGPQTWFYMSFNAGDSGDTPPALSGFSLSARQIP